MYDDIMRVGPGIHAIDTFYVRPRMDASHLIVDGDRAAFVDCGASPSVPHLLAALARLGLGPEAVETILVTHVHLDHAGGAGVLAAACPRARVVVHPRGAQHLADPGRLVEATRAVYGAERFAAWYGEVLAVPAERIAAVADGARIAVGGRTLELLHTPGHALHHLCAFERDTGALWSGDTFGVSYREFDTAAGAFILATTTPSHFDPQQLHASLARLRALRPRAVYLTHYSRVDEVERLGEDLERDIDALVAIAREQAAPVPGRARRIEARIFAHWCERLERHGFRADPTRLHALLDGDAALNADGLDVWLARTGC